MARWIRLLITKIEIWREGFGSIPLRCYYCKGQIIAKFKWREKAVPKGARDQHLKERLVIPTCSVCGNKDAPGLYSYIYYEGQSMRYCP